MAIQLVQVPALSAEKPTAGVVWPLIWLFVVCLCIRLTVGSYLGFHAKLQSDEPEYYNAAVSLSRGDGYSLVPQQSVDRIPRPTAFRMPGPSLILALAFKILGPGIPLARCISAIAGAFAAPLMFLYARQVTTRSAAIVAAIACSIYPAWTYLSQSVGSEAFFVPGLLLSLWLTVVTFRASGRMSFLAGLAWGVTALMRPQALMIAALVALLALWRGRWAIAILLALGAAAAVAPWGIRNFRQFHRFYLLETVSGETFLGANNPYVLSNRSLHGMWVSPMRIAQYRQQLGRVHDDFQRAQIEDAMALRFLQRNARGIPRLVAYKLWRWLTPITGSGGVIRAMVLASYGPLLIFLAIGVPLGVFRNSLPLHLAFICTITFFVATIVYWGILTRGRLPLELIWMPWAAAALCLLLRVKSGISCRPPSA